MRERLRVGKGLVLFECCEELRGRLAFLLIGARRARQSCNWGLSPKRRSSFWQSGRNFAFFEGPGWWSRDRNRNTQLAQKAVRAYSSTRSPAGMLLKPEEAGPVVEGHI